MNKKFLLGLLTLALSVFLSLAPSQSTSASEFFAVLDGQSQVPSRDTPATGKAVFQLDDTKKRINYKLTIANIENVVAAHLHLGKPGENGPIVATLAGPFPPGKGRQGGVLAEGTLEVFNLVGPLIPEPGGENDDRLLAELLEKMWDGKTYVNITTNLGWDPAQIRPGNFPKGEIRGQIQPVGE